jgi:hypothetical protein
MSSHREICLHQKKTTGYVNKMMDRLFFCCSGVSVSFGRLLSLPGCRSFVLRVKVPWDEIEGVSMNAVKIQSIEVSLKGMIKRFFRK